MQLSDTIYNTKIVYLYVNKFDWESNSMGREDSAGNPKAKHVYRAIKNTETGTYRIVYEVTHSVKSTYIDNLKNDNFEQCGYTSDIVELSLSNILECNLSEECLDNLLNWYAIDNTDIKSIVGNIGATKNQERNTVKEHIVPIGVPLSEELVEFISEASHLHDTDPLMFGTMFDLFVYLNSILGEDKGILDTSWMGLSKDHGAGVNVSSAVQKLSRYMGDDRKTNLDESDLLGAIRDLLMEQARRNFNQIE